MSIPELYEAEHFRHYTPREKGVLEKLEKEARKENIPIVGPLVGKMLWVLTRITRARNVLELGTATGYSAIWIAGALRETGGKLVTIEWDNNIAEQARKNIEDAGYSDNVEVLIGNAAELLEGFEQNYFDLVFQDIEKELYLDLLNPCTDVLRPGGLLFFDNTAFKTAGEFLSESLKHPELDGFHLYSFLPEHEPEFDGLTFLIKK